MELFIKKKIGKETYTFTVAGQNLHELVMESQKLSFGTVDKCGKCGSENLALRARVAKKKFKYVEVKCENYDCQAAVVFGCMTEDNNVYYLRKVEVTDSKGKKFKALDWKDNAMLTAEHTKLEQETAGE